MNPLVLLEIIYLSKLLNLGQWSTYNNSQQILSHALILELKLNKAVIIFVGLVYNKIIVNVLTYSQIL